MNRDDIIYALCSVSTAIDAHFLGLDGTSVEHDVGPVALVLVALDEVPCETLRDALLVFLAKLTELNLRRLRILVTSQKEGDGSERLLATTT